ncbi:MAG: putative DNA binding domain-containing protein [Truepera sp.]|nr:putative DNA binding domain-containing protein [Truepera sp.]
MMGRDELARRIRLGEDSTLELKRVLLTGSNVTAPRRNEFADELAGMANGWGGTVVLGVEDKSHEVLGIPVDRLDAVEAWVREICNDSVKPPLDAVIRKVELPSADGSLVAVLCVEIVRSLFVHKSPGGYFRRIGSSKRELSPEVLARLFQERSQSRVIRFDESPVPGTSPEDLDSGLTRQFLREDGALTEDILRKLRIVADDQDGAARITVAGMLLCTQEQERWLPHAQIQAVSYVGERQDINYQSDARDIVGPLDQQIFEALHFARRNMRVAATKKMARAERPQFSDRVVFEALVNAVAHRDYSMAGARIRFHMFRDRLELYVPGALANTLTPDSMHLRQYSRNELIVSLLARFPVREGEELGRTRIMDRRGDGVPIILNESHELSGRWPEYSLIDDSELRLVIWAAK